MPHETILQQIKETELKFKENHYKGGKICSCIVEKHGDLPILLSAPHAIKQIRNHKIKSQEFYTGAIVECLAKQIGCSYIAKQYLNENSTNDDPNTDNASCPYKIAIQQFLQEHHIKLFVDIHGLSHKRDSIVDICIDQGKNVNDMAFISDLKNCIEQQFGVNTCSIDKYFQASSANIISKWVHSTFGITSVELEINGDYRYFVGKTKQQSLDLFLCLKKWLTKFSIEQ